MSDRVEADRPPPPFRAIAEGTYDWESWFGPDGRLRWVNPAVERIAGRGVAECLAMPDYPLPLVHPADRDRVAALLAGARAGSRGNDVEVRLLRPDGAEAWGAVSWQPIADAAGGSLGFRTSVRDITGRKRAEEALRDARAELEARVAERTAELRAANAALREGEVRLRAVLDNAPAAIFLKDAAGRHLLVNRRFTEFLGVAEDEVLGRTDAEVFGARVAAAYRANDRAALAAGRPMEFEEEAPHADGMHVFRVIKAPLLDGAGAPYAVCGVASDVTERRRIERELDRQREVLRTIFEHIPVMIHFGDPCGRVHLVNRCWEETLGYSREDVLGLDLFAACFPDPAERERARAVVRECPPGWHDLRTRARDGRVLETTWSGVALPDGTRIWFGQDISERKRAEEALRRQAEGLARLSRRVVEVQERERRSLARELHDEFGQVLTAIALNLQGLRRSCGPGGEARLRACLAAVRGAIEQVRGLALALRPSVLDDFGLVAALRGLVGRQAEAAGLEAHLDAPADLPGLPPAVATACYRIAQEALTNVARHAGARNVWVEVRRVGREIRLEVRDDGAGFDAAGPEAGAASGPGGGLGMAGMRERSEALGGRVEVETGPGRGTAVRVQIPLGDAAGGWMRGPPGPARFRAARPGSGRGRATRR